MKFINRPDTVGTSKVLKSIFPPSKNKYIRTKVSNSEVEYQSIDGTSTISVTEGGTVFDSSFKTVQIDDMEFIAVSWGNASLLVESYLQNVSYHYSDGTRRYSGYDWALTISEDTYESRTGSESYSVPSDRFTIKDVAQDTMFRELSMFRTVRKTVLESVFTNTTVSADVYKYLVKLTWSKDELKFSQQRTTYSIKVESGDKPRLYITKDITDVIDIYHRHETRDEELQAIDSITRVD